jgi:serine/threonine protein kinase
VTAILGGEDVYRLMQHQPGDVVGHFEMIELLGEGGSGQVWRARAASGLGFSKTVALKLLRQRESGQASAESLLHEARLGADLRHPNIVDVFDVGVSDGSLHVAMEFVDGGSLEWLIERVRTQEIELPFTVVLDIGIGVAKALAWAHHFVDEDGQPRHIVHRDLKPANILLSRSGLPKVADFGLARVVGSTHTTTTGVVHGTPCYLAPETWEGERIYGPTVDLFALGCILWEMMMLRVLFDGETVPQVYGAVAYGDPAEEAAQVADRDPGLARVIEDLLCRDPAQRLGDARELVSKLVGLRRECGPGPDLQEFLASFRPTLRLRDSLPVTEKIPNLVSSEGPAGAGFHFWLRVVVLLAVLGGGFWVLRGSSAVGGGGATESSPSATDRHEQGGHSEQDELPSSDSLAVGEAPSSEPPELATRPPIDPPADSEGAPSVRVVKPPSKAQPSPSVGRSVATTSPVRVALATAVVPVTTPPVAEASGASSKACLVLTSSPGGAQVWLDSVLSKRVARSRARRGDLHAPGKVAVSMGGRSPKAGVQLELRAGEATEVNCSVGASPECTVRSLKGSYCDE